MARDLLVAYLAGLFDGEGSIILRQRGRSVDFLLMASMTDREPIELLKSTFGGGQVEYKVPPNGNKPVFRWTCHGNYAIRALEEMLPFLTVKREKAQIALKLRKLGKFHRRTLTDEIHQQRLELCRQFREVGHL